MNCFPFFFVVAHNIIENVFNKSVSYVIFGAWLQVTLDARRTREYFEVRAPSLNLVVVIVFPCLYAIV